MTKAIEYRAALKFSPDDTGLHLALADTLYSLHRYQESVDELQVAEKLSPGNVSPTHNWRAPMLTWPTGKERCNTWARQSKPATQRCWFPPVRP